MKVTDKDIYMDGYLVKSLNFAIERIKKKHDLLLIIDGVEGSGKSTIGKTVGYYISCKLGEELSADNIFFDIDKMFKFATTTKKQVIIWDESALGGMGDSWQESTHKQLLKLLITCRKYNHVFIFIIPQIRTLRRYFAVDRSLALLRCYLRRNIDRGYFKSYGFHKKAKLYRAEAKGQWHHTLPDYYGRFTDTTGKLINEEQYEKNKDDAILSISEKKERPIDRKRDSVWKNKYAKTLYLLCEENKFLPMNQVARYLGVDGAEISKLLAALRPANILKKAGENVI